MAIEGFLVRVQMGEQLRDRLIYSQDHPAQYPHNIQLGRSKPSMTQDVHMGRGVLGWCCQVELQAFMYMMYMRR